MKTDARPYTVTEITRSIKLTLEDGFSSIAVAGEISNFKRHTSGHLYFTLKDEQSQIAGVMWRSRAAFLPFEPVDGMKVLVTGRITVYEVRGVYQIDAASIRPAGIGELQKAFDELKQRLFAEGLFDQRWKKPIPQFPARIGVVTSPTGAVLHDMVTVIRRRFPGVTLVLAPVRVQGPGAAEDISQAVRDLNAYGGVDVIVVARGGGSLEDLWAFNEESVARAIFASDIPVVSAVGHEVDVTIADFVADLRAPTPSAAAELLVKDRHGLLEIVRDSWYSLQSEMADSLSARRDTVRHILESYAFNRPIDLLRQHSQRIDDLTRSLGISGAHTLERAASRLDGLAMRVASMNPELALKRGYAIVTKQGGIVGSSAMLAVRDAIGIRFHDGTVESTVTGKGKG